MLEQLPVSTTWGLFADVNLLNANSTKWSNTLKQFVDKRFVGLALKGLKKYIPVDTGRKLNVHKTFRRRPGRLLNVLCTFNLCPVSIGMSL